MPHHPVDSHRRSADEEYLHQRVVEGYEGEEEVQVAAAEDDEEEDLGLEGDAAAGLLRADAIEQDDEGEQV